VAAPVRNLGVIDRDRGGQKALIRLQSWTRGRHKFRKVELRWTMISGRGGMGSHKHGVSGRAPRSPRYKFQTQLEAKEKEKAVKKKPPLKAQTVAEALKEKSHE
jgi:hypothetical protein